MEHQPITEQHAHTHLHSYSSMSSVFFSVPGSKSSKTILGCSTTEDSQHESAAEKPAGIV